MTENKVGVSQNPKSFREIVGESLHSNKVSMVGAILFVFLINEIKFIFPDLFFWGIPLALLSIWLISWFKKVGWSDLGISRPKSWSRTITVGIGTMVILQISATVIMSIIYLTGFGSTPDYSSYGEVNNSPWVLLKFLLVSWTTAGFGEEVIWRGFFMKQIARLFNDQKRLSWVFSLLLTSTVFGLIHYSQGITGILMTGVAGLVLGAVYLYTGRNLWASIIAHALMDTTSFIMLYYSDAIRSMLNIN
jgi:membrane protease YdiL (CAAX protease family)